MRFRALLLVGLSLFRSVPNRTDKHTITTDLIKDDVRSSADDELSDSGIHPRSTQAGMVSKRLNDSNNAGRQPLRRLRLVQGYVCLDFLKPRLC